MENEVRRALSKNIVIYHRGERRVRRVLRLFQSLFRLSGASAFSVCSAVKFKDIAISPENSTVPVRATCIILMSEYLIFMEKGRKIPS